MIKSTSILTDNFIGRLEQKPVQTSRYLWHITRDYYYRDLTIAAYGLLCPENYAVFAHSNIFNFSYTYPYFMDSWDFELIELEHSCQFSAYSFWRIDTRLANVDWFIDPNMFDDVQSESCKSEGFNYKNYVCSLNNIPNYALKLFKYDRDRYAYKRPFITRGDGVVSVRPYKNDFDSLVPDIKINKYIQWRNKNIPPCI
jgi:hypothetical protein